MTEESTRAVPAAPPVRVERSGPVTTVVLSRPHVRNAVDGPTARALADAFRAFDADSEASVAVLWGEGGTFCAGADLKALGTPDANDVTEIDAAGGTEDAGGTDRAGGTGGVSGTDRAGGTGGVSGTDRAGGTGGVSGTEDASGTHGVRGTHGVGGPDNGPMGPTRLNLSKPVIAAVSGHAVAGGLELALWCDLRVAEEDAVFGVFCRRWGVPLIDGGTVRLPRIVGEGRALDLVLTGRPVDAAEALGMGLVNRVVPKGAGRAAAERLAAEIAAFPQTCLRHDRLSVREQHGLPERQALAGELRHGLHSLAEAADGAARFAAGAGRHGAFGRDDT
ncbi:crotonase/enoyl-CoA hydratase family protein [Streptomyces sp. NPDC017941]|uniref:crotonase/enoyl-CoA hydratase family protein n=1 Tax=Streptomyces sp. NPDC017941 TaxID=3365018 RepID=UPI00378B048F